MDNSKEMRDESAPRASGKGWGLGLFLVLALLATLTDVARAERPSPAKPLTKERQARLTERDRHEKAARKLRAAGKLTEAIAEAEKMLAIEREVFGNPHQEIANSLKWLAEIHEERVDFAIARAFRTEALAMLTRLKGKDHWRVTDARLALAHLELLVKLTPDQRARLAGADRDSRKIQTLKKEGKYHEAIPLAENLVKVRRRLLGDKDRDYAQSLHGLGALHADLGDYARAEPLLRQALQIRKQALGEQHSSYAATLGKLADLYRVMGDYTKAEPLFRQALAIEKHLFGDKHTRYAVTLNDLALLYGSMGEFTRAEAMLRQALDIDKRALGDGHPSYAISLSNLAGLFMDMGDYAQARPLLVQALAIQRRTRGENHPHYATYLNNLAQLYVATDEYGRALPLYREVLAIRKRTLGEDHPDYAATLDNFADLCGLMGDYAGALPLSRQALTIRKRLLGDKHPDYAKSLNNLALLYDNLGEHAKAETAYRQALAIEKQVFGEKHPEYATSLSNLGMCYLAQADIPRAEPLFRQALEIYTSSVHDWLGALGERQRIRLMDCFRVNLHAYASVKLAGKGAAEDLYRYVLAWKGAVAARQADDRIARDRPELKDHVARLDRARSRLARLSLAVPKEDAHFERWLTEINALRNEKEELENALARQSKAYLKARKPLDAAQVAESLPRGAAFIDFVEHTHFFRSRIGKGLAFENRLLAFVLVRGKKPVLVDLSAAGPITSAVKTWRQAVAAGKAAVTDAAGKVLAERIWKPLRRHLDGIRVALVAPDGALAQFPLAALPGLKPGSFLLEELAFVYVTSGQDVIESFRNSNTRPARGLLTVGGIDYEARVPGAKAARPKGLLLAAKDRSGFGFLKNTEAEALRCRDLFAKSFHAEPRLLLKGAEPSRKRLKAELGKGYRYLHLATHGFFEPAHRMRALRAGAHGEERALSRTLGEKATETFGLAALLRSGVVLAGAGRRSDGEDDQDDGILTAEEVQALDLRGMELVVLSACETGLGDLEQGEGVMGLQRAFGLAGARTVLASLWKVDDEATRLLMERFYDNLWAKKMPKLEALRQAQLSLLREARAGKRQRGLEVIEEEPEKGQPGRGNLRLWAAWVLSGDPGDLHELLADSPKNRGAD